MSTVTDPSSHCQRCEIKLISKYPVSGVVSERLEFVYLSQTAVVHIANDDAGRNITKPVDQVDRFTEVQPSCGCELEDL